LFTNLAVLQYPATAWSRKLNATAKYLRHGCFRESNISILTRLSCQPLRNSFRFDSFTCVCTNAMHSCTSYTEGKQLNQTSMSNN